MVKRSQRSRGPKVNRVPISLNPEVSESWEEGEWVGRVVPSEWGRLQTPGGRQVLSTETRGSSRWWGPTTHSSDGRSSCSGTTRTHSPGPPEARLQDRSGCDVGGPRYAGRPTSFSHPVQSVSLFLFPTHIHHHHHRRVFFPQMSPPS